MPKLQSGPDDVPTQVEALLQLSAEVGVEGVVLFGVVLLLYFVTGVTLTTALGVKYPYSFFSLTSDPILLIDSTIVGFFTTQGAGSLLLYHLSVGVDTEAVPSVVLSCIGVGLGGAILQVALPRLLQMIFKFV